MQDHYYPPIDEGKILVAVRLASEDATYLSNPNCPYSDKLKDVLGGVRDAEDVRTDGLVAEIRELRKQLKDRGDKLDGAEASEVNTYFRLSAVLIEKLITLEEKAAGIHQVKAFTEAVMRVMEDVLDADQRGTVLDHLRSTLSQ